MATAPVHISRTHPFAVLTAHSLPEVIKPRERTNYGWETLKVKQLIRIPTKDGVADSAYMSMSNWNKKKELEWAEAEAAERDRIRTLEEVTQIEDEDEQSKAVLTLMEQWYAANGEEAPRVIAQPAYIKGKLVKAKKGGGLHEYVEYDSPEGEDLPKTPKGKEQPAFKDFIRVV